MEKYEMRKEKHRSFEDAKKFVHTLELKSEKYWRKFVKSGNLPKDIPSNPNVVYKNKGWIGYPDWLGNKNTPDKDKKYRSYEDAKKFVHTLELKSRSQWEQYCKSDNKPDDIPMNAARTYKNKGWVGLSDWLGHTTVATNIKSKNYLPWAEAKKEYQKLAKQYNITNFTQWRTFFPKHKKLLEQLHLPESPWLIYTKQRVWRNMK
jgi:hypothetical protein